MERTAAAEINPGLSRLIPVDETAGKNCRALCEQLESGNILFFAKTPFDLPAADREFLLQQRQTQAGFHKNIAYRPEQDRLTGLEKAGEDAPRLRAVLKNYSEQVTQFLAGLLPPYAQTWRRDFASFRPLEERGRQSRVRARNDLLHTDAFPTRPTNGDRILRIFTNLNPADSRVWLTGETFEFLARRMAVSAGLPRATNPVRFLKALVSSIGIPVTQRSPYDEFMLRFHNFLKENAEFQSSCPKTTWNFPPDSTWIVFTDMVSHAVLEGQFALEQTFIVSRHTMVAPEHAPFRVLEQICGFPVTTA